MGHHHAGHRRRRQLLEVAPTHRQRAVLQPLPLAGGHAGIGFHQHQFGAGGQLGPAGHQRLRQLARQLAFAWTYLHQGQGPVGLQLLQPLGQLGGQQGGKLRAERRGGHEVAGAADAQAAGSVSAVVGVVQGPVHVGAERHAAAGRVKTLLQPEGNGHGQAWR